MLHRVVKKNDVNKDKWIGVGGHFEYAESPEECLLREVKEETGYTLTSWKYRGIVTFVYGEDVVEYMSLYTADGFTGDPIECDEGVLEWVEKEKIKDLNLWEGDKIFFRLMDEEEEFFSLKLVYNKSDVLEYVALNGKPMELFDVIDEDGNKTGQVKERGVAHRDGTLHATVHIWIVRPNQESGYDVLLQKRSECKDSNPGAYDISSAGHVSAGDELMESALREMKEELGIDASVSDLHFVDKFVINYKKEFYGKMFKDSEIAFVYVYTGSVDIDKLTLQKEELDRVDWFNLEYVYEECKKHNQKFCAPIDGLEIARKYVCEYGI